MSLSLATQEGRVTGIVDGHHHIWRQADLPWLVGPMQPRIFGPYEPIRRDYPIAEYLADIAGCGVVKSVYVQTNWAKERFEDEAAWVQRTAEETGWPHAIVAYADFARRGRPPAARPARAISARARRAHAAALAREPALPLRRARRPLPPTRRFERNVARLADYGWSFDLQVFAPQMPDAAALAEACPNVTFVLQHAGMLEDLSPAGRADWRAGMVRLAACPNVVSKLSGLGTFIHRNDPAHIAAIVRRDGRDLRRRALPVRLELSDREALDELSRSRRAPIATPRAKLGAQDRDAILHETAMRVYRLAP